MNINVHRNEYSCASPQIYIYLGSQRAITALHLLSSSRNFTCIITLCSFIKFMNFLLLFAYEWVRTGKLNDIMNVKGQ